MDCEIDNYKIILSVLLLVYFFFDVNYFLRCIISKIVWTLLNNKTTIDGFTDTYGFCTTQDIDWLMNHMNNARYIRELDFAIFQYCHQTGIQAVMSKRKSYAVRAATSIRYRRSIPLFSFYKIRTRAIAWNDKDIYFEHQFITRDNFIRAVILAKQTTIGDNTAEIMAEASGKDISWRPEPLPELESWIKSMDISSQRLKKKD